MLKKKLKKALKEAGLSEGLADVINITSEDQIENIVNQLKQSSSDDEPEIDFEDILQSDAFNEFVEENGFDAVIQLSKTLQSEHDRKVTKGIKNGLDNFLKKKGGKSKSKDENIDDDLDLEDDKIPPYVKALMKKIDKLEKNNNQSDFSAKVNAALSKSKLPKKLQEKWGSRIVDGDVSIEKQVEALEKEHEEIHKEIIGGNAGGGLPTGGSPNTDEASDDEVDALAERLI